MNPPGSNIQTLAKPNSIRKDHHLPKSLVPAASVWDCAAGVKVTGHSGLFPTSDARSLFGARVGTLEAGEYLVMFEDGHPEPFAHWLEWTTPAPVTIKSLRVSAFGDFPQTTSRQFKGMRLFVKENGEWKKFYEVQTPGQYEWESQVNWLLRSFTLEEPVQGSEFRAEFDQHDLAPGSPGGGPKVTRLEAFDTELPTMERPLVDGHKFFNVIFYMQDFGGEGASIVGIHRFVDAARERGIFERFRMTLILPGDEERIMPGERDFFRSLYDEGHEIGAMWTNKRASTAAWLGIPESAITMLGAQMYADSDMEEQAAGTLAGFRASSHACVEGSSLMEFWDHPHNWEGSPMFPYWVQWDDKKPMSTARINRELDKSKAILELSWITRTLWHNYDRFPLPQCWHLGEPIKQGQWNVGQLVKAGQGGGWWRAELEEYERNLRLGRSPFLYLNNGSEANIFAPGGPWSGMLDPDEALETAMDQLEMVIKRGWQLTTVAEFTDWFAERWPCPESPSMIYLVNDTLANRPDREGKTIIGQGRLVHAETKYYQISDNENRIAPEMVIAYDLRTPNLLRGGYTFANPDKWDQPESLDGHYASTAGNAVFWSPGDPLANVDNIPYCIPSKQPAARNRTFTLYVGDQWEPYQFASGNFFGVLREGDTVRWSKEMAQPVAGTDTRVIYHHVLDGPDHRVRVEVLGRDAVGKPVRLRLGPYFHQGWDHRSFDKHADPRVPDPDVAGQERNVFGRAGGKEFAYSENNPARISESHPLTGGTLQIFNRNPGSPGGTYDDNPDFNRGMTVTLSNAPDASVEWIDEPGPNINVTADIHFGPHKAGQHYEFSFRYWHGEPKYYNTENYTTL